MVTIGRTWDRTTEFIGEHLGGIASIALAGVMLPLVVQSWIGLLPPGGVGRAAALSVLLLVLNLVPIWAAVALAALVIAGGGVRGAARVGLARFLPMLGVSILLGLGLVALMLPLIALIGMAGAPFQVRSGADVTRLAAAASSPAVVVAGLVTLVLVIVLVVRMTPLTAVVAAERRGAGALRRTWRLTRGLTGRLIGVAILYLVMFAIALAAAQLVVGAIAPLVLSSEPGAMAGAIVVAAAGAAVSTAFSVLATVFAANLYLLARERDDAVAEPA